MNFDPFKLSIVFICAIIIMITTLAATKKGGQRMIISGLLAGIFFYNGLGACDASVPYIYIFYYFNLSIFALIGFYFGCLVFLPISITIGKHVNATIITMEKLKYWRYVIYAYILLTFSLLVWPEFKLHLLFSPPTPDLLTAFSTRFTVDADIISRLIEYARVLILPFFYVALYSLRSKLRVVFIILLITLYVEYLSKAYIGRGIVVMNIGYIILALWILRPEFRIQLLFSLIAAVPIIFMILFWYEKVRIGGTFDSINIADAFTHILDSEIGFVKDVGAKILDSNARVDLNKYLVWIATLPIPKIFTGNIDGARINYEISEKILGLTIGTEDWYVVLPGLVAESIYIYGSKFYFLHGLFIGFLASFFFRLVERVSYFLFLFLYIFLMFSYVLNRGGIGALLPPIINGFLLFFIFLIITIWRSQSKTRTTHLYKISSSLNTKIAQNKYTSY